MRLNVSENECCRLHLTKPHSDWLTDHHGVIARCLDLRNGLLGILLRRRVITYQQSAEIKSQTVSINKNNMLIDIMRTKSCDEFTQFVAALKEDGQFHIYNYIMDSDHSPGRPTFLFDQIPQNSVRQSISIINIVEICVAC